MFPPEMRGTVALANRPTTDTIDGNGMQWRFLNRIMDAEDTCRRYLRLRDA